MKIKLLICALLLMELGVYAQQQPTNVDSQVLGLLDMIAGGK